MECYIVCALSSATPYDISCVYILLGSQHKTRYKHCCGH